jgi:hypothetical protein
MYPIADSTVRDPATFTVVLSAILGFLHFSPIEPMDGNKIDAMLAQIAGPLRLVPLEFHAVTVRM